jgi:hypothetical protein
MVSSEIANRRKQVRLDIRNDPVSGNPFYFTLKELVWQVDEKIRTQFFQSC